MVMANGSSGDSGGGTLRSLFLSLSLRVEEEGGGSVLVSFKGLVNGSVRVSRDGRGGGGAQAVSEGFRLSWDAGRSNAAKKGSSGGMCLQLHTLGSISEAPKLRENAGNGNAGVLTELSIGSGERPGEGSLNAARKGSEGRPKVIESLG